MRLVAFLTGRVCRREGVRASPWPVFAGTELATGGLLGLFSLGLRRGDGLLEVFERGFRGCGVDMVDAGQIFGRVNNGLSVLGRVRWF